MKKVKVFLGAYINQTNAQNLSARTLAEYLDKTKFDVHTLCIKHGNIKGLKLKGVKIFTCFFPVKVTGRLGFLWGIYHCDVVFLPRGNFYRYQRFLVRLFKKKSFKTMENILDDTSLKSAVSIIGTEKQLKEAYGYCDELYAITRFMKTYNEDRFGIKSEELILPLVNNTSFFEVKGKKVPGLSEVIFIGNDMLRKGIHDYIAMAEAHSDIVFNIVGREPQEMDLKGLLKTKHLKNVRYHGLLAHEALLDVLKRCQMNILPSRSEGFPKSIIETAAAAVPTMTYGDYGAEEWIVNHENGYVADNVEEMVQVLRRYKENPVDLQKMTDGAMALAERFEVRKVVGLYETIIESLHEKRNK